MVVETSTTKPPKQPAADAAAATTPTSVDTSGKKKPAAPPSGSYGVRSYLHHFYEPGGKNPDGSDQPAEYAYLIPPKRVQSRFCRPILWKVTVWIGINLLVFGTIGIFVAYLVPKRQVYMETKDGHYFLVDQAAQGFNNNLEVVKLVGLLVFSLGGGLTIIGLLIPTLLWHYCADERSGGEEGFRVRVFSDEATGTPLDMTSPPVSPTAVTATAGVQPDRRKNEAVITQEGAKEIN